MAMNPVIKFTTLFGLLAVELAIELDRSTSAVLVDRVRRGDALLRVPLLLRHAHHDRGRGARDLTGPGSMESRDAGRHEGPVLRESGLSPIRPCVALHPRASADCTFAHERKASLGLLLGLHAPRDPRRGIGASRLSGAG